MADQLTEEAFVQEATAFLDANVERRDDTALPWGQGSDQVGLFEEQTPEQEATELAEAKAWRRKVFDAGFGWIHGPSARGGRGLPASYARRWQSLQADYDVPSSTPFAISLGMVAPTILAHGTEVAKDRYLRALYRGDLIGCQLFSEPGAGSDVAGLQARAERDGDQWVVNGQKVWTSGAQYSDLGEIVCRTNPTAPKHKGITAFVVDMHAPGVEIRPLRQMTGGTRFNEVFFTDVRIPDDHRLGGIDDGWTVAITTLMNERAAIGGGGVDGSVGSVRIDRLIDLIRHVGRDDDAVLRQSLADIWINATIARWSNLRAMANVNAGRPPGPEMSIGKLATTNNLQRVIAFVSATLGPKLVTDSDEWGTYAWSEFVLGVPGFRVAGGTDEVLRNIIGERVLGLPKEPAS